MNIVPVGLNGAKQAVSVVVAAPKRVVTVQTSAGSETAASIEQVRRMVEEMQSQIQRMNVSLEFSRYGGHGEKIAVVVADKATGEVIREIPSRELQNLYNSINDLAGIIFNRQA
jgi:flagellar protein FlaG